MTEKRVVHTTKNAAPIQGDFGGAGLNVNYFFSRNIGFGIEGNWIEGEKDIASVVGTLMARLPLGSNAPYVFGSAGARFGDGTKGVGILGAGLEHRFSPFIGVFVDAGWQFSEHENAALFRAGMRFIY